MLSDQVKLLSITESELKENKEKRESRLSIEDKLYEDCSETDIVDMIGGFVTYC